VSARDAIEEKFGIKFISSYFYSQGLIQQCATHSYAIWSSYFSPGERELLKPPEAMSLWGLH